MKWIELIRIRSSASTLQAVLPSLQEQIKAIEASAPEAATFFLQHALYDGDLAVVVVWKNEAKQQKTTAGLMVVDQIL